MNLLAVPSPSASLAESSDEVKIIRASQLKSALQRRSTSQFEKMIKLLADQVQSQPVEMS